MLNIMLENIGKFRNVWEEPDKQGIEHAESPKKSLRQNDHQKAIRKTERVRYQR